jgi:DNA-binding GntR family transcriptional regulator
VALAHGELAEQPLESLGRRTSGALRAQLELADFEQLCALRLAVEPMAVRLSVPHLTDEDLIEWRSAERYRRLMVAEDANLGAIAQLANSDHASMLRAAMDRDGDACADRVAQHISKVSTITLSIIDSSRDPWVLRTAAGCVIERRSAASR